MKRFVISVVLLCAAAAYAIGQVPYFPQTLPGQSVVGRLSANPGATEAIPFSKLAVGLQPLIGVTVGASVIKSGTDTRILYDNAGILGELAITGTGPVVLSNSPVLVTPALGTPASGVATNLTGTAAGLTAGHVTTNANLTGPITSVGNATSIASQTGTGTKFVVDTSPTLASPTFTGTVAGSNTIPLSILAQIGANTVLGNSTSGTANATALSVGGCSSASSALIWTTNTGFGCNTSITATTNANLTGVITSVGNATSIASQTGTGTKFVVDTSPTLVTPVLGVATATSINKTAITAPATSSTLAVADGKTLTASNSLTLAGADSTTITFQASDTYVGRGTTDTLTNKSLTSAIATGTFDVQQAAKWSGSITPTALSGDVNDYAPTGFSTATVIRQDGGAADRNITGLAAGADGLIKVWLNTGTTNKLILKDGSASSSAANRYALGSDLQLAPNQGAILRYDATLSRWTAMGVFVSGGGSSGTVTSVATGFGLTGGTITTSGTASISTSAPPFGFDAPVNLGLTSSVGSNILTINVTDQAGSTPSASSPVLVPFRSATAATGTPTWVSITSALSITTNATGATLGTANTVPFRMWIVMFSNSGTPVLALWQSTTGGASPTALAPLNETAVASTTGISGSATSAGTFYTPNGTSLTSMPYRIIGFLEYSSGLTTAGTYASTPTRLQLFGPGVKKPGDVVQTAYVQTMTTATGTTTIPGDDTIPQSTEGDQYMSLAITPTAAMNRLRISTQALISNSAGVHQGLALFQDSTANALTATMSTIAASNEYGMQLFWEMLANTTSSTTFKVRSGGSSAGTTKFNGGNALAEVYGGVANSYMRIEEVMQ